MTILEFEVKASPSFTNISNSRIIFKSHGQSFAVPNGTRENMDNKNFVSTTKTRLQHVLVQLEQKPPISIHISTKITQNNTRGLF